MKKIFAMAMAFVVVATTFASCSSKYTKGSSFKKGEITDEGYENKSAGIGIKLPEGYEVSEDPDFEYVAEDSSGNGDNIVVAEEGSYFLDIDRSLEASLEEIEKEYEKMDISISESKLVKYTIDDNTYGGYRLKLVTNDVEFNQSVFVIQCGDKALSINFTCRGDSDKLLKECVYILD